MYVAFIGQGPPVRAIARPVVEHIAGHCATTIGESPDVSLM